MDQSRRGVQDRYLQHQQPPQQMVLIHQDSPIINLNIGSLVQNYQSLIYQNQEEVFFQLASYDIPRHDNLQKVFSDQYGTIAYQIDVIPYFISCDESLNPMMRATAEGVEWESKPLFGYAIDTKHLNFQFDLSLYTDRIELILPESGVLTETEIAAQIAQQLQYLCFYYSQRESDGTTDDVKQVLMRAFYQSIRTFCYDSDTNKYLMKLELPRDKFISSEVIIADNMFLSRIPPNLQIVGFELFFTPLIASSSRQVADLTNQSKDAQFVEQHRLAVQLLGGEYGQQILNYSYPRYSVDLDGAQFYLGQHLRQYQHYSQFKTFLTKEPQRSVLPRIRSNIFLYDFLPTVSPNTPYFDAYIQCHSNGTVKLYSGDMVYITTSGDSQAWSHDGARLGVIDVVPRNTADWSQQSKDQLNSALAQQPSPIIKTKLSNFRNLRITLTNKDGNYIYPSRPFMLKLMLYFG